MKQFLAKLKSLEQQIAGEKGAFQFFALLLRDEAPDKWDLVAAAPWLDRGRGSGLKYLSEKVVEALTQEELLALSRIVVLKPDNAALKAFQKTIGIEHGDIKLQDCHLFGMDIKEAHVITSRRAGVRQSEQAV